MSVFIDKFNIFDLINYLYPNCIVTCSPEGTPTQQYSSLVWRDSECTPPYENPNPKPTQSELEAKWDECYIYLKRKEIKNKVAIKHKMINEGGIIHNSIPYYSTREEREKFREAMINNETSLETRDMNGIRRTLDFTAIQEIVNVFCLLRKNADEKKFMLEDIINISNDPENVDIETGWPVIPYISS